MIEHEQEHEHDYEVGARIANHLPVAHFHPAGRSSRHLVAVSHYDQRGQPLGGDLLQQSHHGRRGMRIKVAGRLIRDQERRPVNQGPGDCRPLLLAAAELMGEMSRSIREPDQINQFRGPFFTFVRRHPLQEQGKADVFEHIHRRQKVEELKDEADAAAPIFRKRVVVRTVQRKAIDKNLARGRIFESGQEMNERALAAAARPAHRDKFIPRDFQRNAVQRVHRPLAGRIMARDIPERDQGSFIRHGRSSRKSRQGLRHRGGKR